MTRFGPQPARQAIRDSRWTVKAAAEQINVPRSHLVKVLTGDTTPSRAVRDRLPALTSKPLTALFTAEALAAEYHPRRGPGGRVRPGQSWITEYDR